MSQNGSNRYETLLGRLEEGQAELRREDRRYDWGDASYFDHGGLELLDLSELQAREAEARDAAALLRVIELSQERLAAGAAFILTELCDREYLRPLTYTIAMIDGEEVITRREEKANDTALFATRLDLLHDRQPYSKPEDRVVGLYDTELGYGVELARSSDVEVATELMPINRLAEMRVEHAGEVARLIHFT